MTELTTKLAEALRRCKRLIPVSSDEWAEADWVLERYDEAEAQPVQDLPPLPDAHWVEEFSHGTLVYTADQMHAYARAALAATPAAAPQPLTDEQIDGLDLAGRGVMSVRDMVRIVERAHGIGASEGAKE